MCNCTIQIAIWETQVQVETQIVFLEKQRGKNHKNKKNKKNCKYSSHSGPLCKTGIEIRLIWIGWVNMQMRY